MIIVLDGEFSIHQYQDEDVEGVKHVDYVQGTKHNVDSRDYAVSEDFADSEDYANSKDLAYSEDSACSVDSEESVHHVDDILGVNYLEVFQAVDEDSDGVIYDGNVAVVATAREPIYGWIDNMYGPTGVQCGVGAGLLRTFEVNEKCAADMVPVDMAVNAIIASAWDVR